VLIEFDQRVIIIDLAVKDGHVTVVLTSFLGIEEFPDILLHEDLSQ